MGCVRVGGLVELREVVDMLWGRLNDCATRLKRARRYRVEHRVSLLRAQLGDSWRFFEYCFIHDCSVRDLIRSYGILVSGLYLILESTPGECMDRGELVELYDKAFRLATDLTVARLTSTAVEGGN
jgi:hypothetical protein